jgi:hypothetical protein
MMNKLVRILLGLAGFGLLALVFMPTSEHRAAASNPGPVVVTNTPLPVQGTVSVSNTPSVNVANTPSVNVANTAVQVRGNVQVFNPLDSSNNPVPLVVNTPGQPYADHCAGGGSFNATCTMNTLPSGMRLVIQAVSYHAVYGQGDNVIGLLATTVNNSTQGLFLTLSDAGLDQFANANKTATIFTQVYADAGSAPQCQADGTGGLKFQCTISGYLIPAP